MADAFFLFLCTPLPKSEHKLIKPYEETVPGLCKYFAD